jgi:hypothetical protein
MPSATAQNIEASYWLAAVAGGLLAGSVVLAFLQCRRTPESLGPWAALLGALLIAVHPAWTISARSGDCGMMKQFFSLVVAGILVLIVLGQLVSFVVLFNRRDSQEKLDYDDKSGPDAWSPLS